MVGLIRCPLLIEEGSIMIQILHGDMNRYVWREEMTLRGW